MCRLFHCIGLGIRSRLLSQIRVGGPLGVEMNPEVQDLRVADLAMCVGKQVEGGRGPVEGGSPRVELAIPAGAKTQPASPREIRSDGEHQLQLGPQLAKAPERIGVVFLEITKARPKGARRERNVRFEL